MMTKIVPGCLAVFIAVMHAQILPDPHQHALVVQGLSYTVEGRYDSAENRFGELIRRYPKHPAGYLYSAGLLQARAVDYGTPLDEKQYDSLLLTVAVLADSMKEETSSKAWGWYYEGTAEAFRSFTASENGNLPLALYYGMGAARSLSDCLDLDTGFVAAKNALGSYYYWQSKLSWIPFVSDKRAMGIRYVLEASRHPYERHLALQNLMLISIDRGRFEDAERYGRELLHEYPDNRSAMWNLVTTYEQSRQPKKTEEVVQRLLRSALAAPIVNRYTEATCRLKLAQFALDRGDTVRAREQLFTVIALRKSPDARRKTVTKKIDAAQEMIETLERR